MAVVTISRQLGSGARAIGLRAAELLGYDVVDKALITEVADQARVDEEEVAEIDEVEEPGVRGFLSRWFTMENAAIVVWFTPSRIWRSALGARTRQKSWPGVAPAISPASMTSVDTRESPRCVFRTVGGKA